MQQNSLIDMDYPVTKYCLIYDQQIVSNWNTKAYSGLHRIPGTRLNILCSSVGLNLQSVLLLYIGQRGGVPNQMALDNCRAASIDSRLVPDVSNAVSLYQASGGRLGAETGFGVDPLSVSTELIQQWQAAMESNIPSPELFVCTVNGFSHSRILKYL